MMVGNHSMVTEFILMGLTDEAELQLPLFFLFFGVYIVSMVGNLGLVLLIKISSQLHTPMYYFLSNLSFIDLCYSSVIIPKMMVNFVSEENIISFPGCLTQFFFFGYFAVSECYMLAAMAYDRYVAICHPLLYHITMSQRVCFLLVAGVHIIGICGAFIHTSFLADLTFCRAKVINHYFCDILPILKLSCSNTYINEFLLVFNSGINVFLTTLSIFISYAFILSNILQIRSADGRAKAFKTCGSHVAVVAVFYGSIIFMYFKPSYNDNNTQEKVASVFYTIVNPMLNPMIYSFRNKDVKDSLRKVMKNNRF
ncbi:olfactory receptor 8A1-like [Trichosurus vulpecula]|uniref:olfactory receptor 8A1-like n=1 Tax=Trichosurus vulpecula TaxID=9337 RepID=UPI00186B336E|nr:olfactory receptor 8A1-like [Trichosurus vulpecula]